MTSSWSKGLAAQGAGGRGRHAAGLALSAARPRPGGQGADRGPDNRRRGPRTAIRSGRYGTTLLKGVTGSGKTEVYLEAVAETLRMGRQALLLLPEIALTSEFLTRVEARFGAKPGNGIRARDDDRAAAGVEDDRAGEAAAGRRARSGPCSCRSAIWA